ncbi:MAG: hypothetical protein IJY09_02875 [Lachnospiraceae bacterium]|nr:hypothetical protein [Lachnospiraceae bacterium]
MEKANVKINKGIMLGWTVIGVTLFVAYILELVKKARTVPYFLVFAAMDLIPLIIGWMMYRKNKDSKMIRYISAGFYGILYVFVLLTAATPMAFCYIFPMLYVLMLTNDKKLIGVTGIGIVVSNVASIVIQAMKAGAAVSEKLAEFEIQAAAAIFCSVFGYCAVKISHGIHETQLQAVKESEERLAGIFGQVTEVSGVVEQGTHSMTEELVALNIASEKTAAAMTEIVSGTAQTSEMVEKQLQMTANIQEIIDQTNTVSEEILDCVGETQKKVEAGIGNMKKLSESAVDVEKNSKQVIEHMGHLSETTDEVQNIITLIDGIAEQTNLLALNASIEAARAGEAGRGFAVVAGEINGLATQTQSATANITQMVNTLREKAEQAAEAVQKMAELNREQNDIIFDTDAAFGGIRDGVEKVKNNAELESRHMSKLLEANGQIVESVHTISAVSEEVMANTNETQEIAQNNREAVERVTTYSKELNERVEELRSYVG